VTLLPSKDFQIRGHEGKAYEVNEICAVPGCGRESAHVHHLWPRSHLRSQPYEWVKLPDGTVIGNRIGMCREHHEDVTGPLGGYRARIAFSSGLFWWMVRSDNPPEEQMTGALVYQPPGVKDENGVVVPDEICPTCGHAKQRRTNGKPRKSKEWTLVVPDDAEIGSDVLDEWADEIAATLGFHDESSRLRRYHAVATALAWVIQNRQAFLDDLKAARR